MCASLDDKVVDSRLAEDGVAIRRRRECLACGRRFTTYERLDDLPLHVHRCALARCMQAQHLRYFWDGQAITEVTELKKVG